MIGYRLLESLHQFLFIPHSSQPDQVAWQPEWVAEHWAPEAKRVFDTSPAAERALGARFLKVGISPDQNMGTLKSPASTLSALQARTLTPGFMRRGLNVAHIGSGSTVRRYVQAFRGHFRYHFATSS